MINIIPTPERGLISCFYVYDYKKTYIIMYGLIFLGAYLYDFKCIKSWILIKTFTHSCEKTLNKTLTVVLNDYMRTNDYSDFSFLTIMSIIYKNVMKIFK